MKFLDYCFILGANGSAKNMSKYIMGIVPSL